jgi:hypothetical protein
MTLSKTIIDLVPILDPGYYFVEPLEYSARTASGIYLASLENQSVYLRDLHQKEAVILAYNTNVLSLNIGDVVMPHYPTTKPFSAPKEFFIKKTETGYELCCESDWLSDKKVFADNKTYTKENTKKIWPLHYSEVMCVRA